MTKKNNKNTIAASLFMAFPHAQSVGSGFSLILLGTPHGVPVGYPLQSLTQKMPYETSFSSLWEGGYACGVLGWDSFGEMSLLSAMTEGHYRGIFQSEPSNIVNPVSSSVASGTRCIENRSFYNWLIHGPKGKSSGPSFGKMSLVFTKDRGTVSCPVTIEQTCHES